jgi:hypothetical protein
MLNNSAGEPLFVDGQPSPFVRRATEFCAAFQRHHVATRALVAALQAAGLLVPRTASVRLADGRRLQVGGFRLIDEARLDALPDAQFLDWRRRGWLPLVYAQLAAAGNWDLLARRLADAG